MKVLFDVNVPKRLRRSLRGHAVPTAQEEGWGAAKNGQLLRAAEAANFDVIVTADKNLRYQQNLKDRTIAVVVLATNDWSILEPIAFQVAALVDAARPGSYR